MKLYYGTEQRDVILPKDCYRVLCSGSSRTIWCEPLDDADRAKLDARKSKFQKWNNSGTGKIAKPSNRDKNRLTKAVASAASAALL